MQDTYMDESVTELRDALVGSRIIMAEKNPDARDGWNRGAFIITLDNGRQVEVYDTNDCCAYTDLESFIYNVAASENVITDVATEADYQTWHIYAGMNEVLQLGVAWSEGSGYYGYGFSIKVKDVH